MNQVSLPTKLVGETKNYYFDFISVLAIGETISTQSVVMSVFSGTDASPASMLSGSASASGTIVTQKLTGGTLGVMYQALCTITTSAGQTLQLAGYVVVGSPVN